MSSRSSGVRAAVALVILAEVATAQRASHVVTFSVVAQSGATVSAATFPSSAAGSQTPALRVATGSCSFSTNDRRLKITASLDDSLPTGVSLEMMLASPLHAARARVVALGMMSTDVTRDVASAREQNLRIRYGLSGVRNADSVVRTVIFTVVAGA